MKSISFHITEQDIDLYSTISGDFNSIHLDHKEAKQQGFQGRVAHGMLTMAKIWSVVSHELFNIHQFPSRYELSFISPVYINDVITITVKQSENLYRVVGRCNGRLIVKGTFIVE